MVPNLSRHRKNRALVALGAVIREKRLAVGLSQEQLAFIAELDRSYLGQIERGDSNVTVLNLKQLAEALGTSIEEIAGVALI